MKSTICGHCCDRDTCIPGSPSRYPVIGFANEEVYKGTQLNITTCHVCCLCNNRANPPASRSGCCYQFVVWKYWERYYIQQPHIHTCTQINVRPVNRRNWSRGRTNKRRWRITDTGPTGNIGYQTLQNTHTLLYCSVSVCAFVRDCMCADVPSENAFSRLPVIERFCQQL